MIIDKVDELINEMIKYTGKNPSVLEMGYETYLFFIYELRKKQSPLKVNKIITKYKRIPIKIMVKIEGIIVKE